MQAPQRRVVRMLYLLRPLLISAVLISHSSQRKIQSLHSYLDLPTYLEIVFNIFVFIFSIRPTHMFKEGLFQILS